MMMRDITSPLCILVMIIVSVISTALHARRWVGVMGILTF